ncbi:toll/interleukin-1 receptor domain-containing protein, partial [Nostoc sp. S13]|uniref:toll/interleukin-1 receptor domain-containing protein n=2 Tax=unclassified Nostoc TaxID=2593658 RepID=UPI002629A1A6
KRLVIFFPNNFYSTFLLSHAIYIKDKSNDMEAELQLPSHTKIIPDSISQGKGHQTCEVLSSTKAIEVFISYSREDEKLLKALERYLSSSLEGIKIWHEAKTIGGQTPKVEIEKHLNSADIILLLISPNFLSDYDNKIEINLARAREQPIKATVIPVLLTKIIGWERYSFANLKLANLEPLPQKDKFITDRRVWINKNDAFYFTAQGLEKVKEEKTSRNNIN